jgi:hypothetical protein
MTFVSGFFRLLWILVVVLGAGACSQSDDASDLPTKGEPVNGQKPSSQQAGWTRAADEVCDPREQAIESWIDGFRHCARDADCEVTEIAANCVASFLCPTVLSTKIDRAAFEREAIAKQAEYEPECGCAIARCAVADTMTAYCEPATKRCAVKYGCRNGDDGAKSCRGPLPVSPADASAGDAAAATEDASTQDASANSDAGASSVGDAGAGAFACQVAADCEIKNVGNCCGYYPRCANKASVFGPPRCDQGQSGVCGWPEIDECSCRQNTCRSLQNGNEI